MIKEILKYPDDRINIGSGNVRFFDDELAELINDMIETAQAHQSRGLAAIQLAIPMAVIVVQNEKGEWMELINPRIIKHQGNTLSKEQTLYLPDVTEEIPRFEKISVVYQDKEGKDKTLIAEKDFACLLQRKIDYIFGGTFINKLDKKEQEKAKKVLSQHGLEGEFNACPTFSKREYFKSAMNKILFLNTLALSAPLFSFETNTLSKLYTFAQYSFVFMVILIISYLLYAKYEAEKYVSCTGCQVVGITAVAVKYFIGTVLLFAGSYFLVNPN